MRKARYAGLALAVAVLFPPVAARGQAPLRDTVFGSGHVLETDFVATGEAGPNGEDPVGSLTVSGFLNFTTATTCLNISGHAVVGGGRILTGRDAGKGFLSSSVDHGPPVEGRPVDVTVYSGLLARPPRNCPSPGDAPPALLRHTGGGRFTSGDLTVVDAVERVPSAAPSTGARVVRLAHGPAVTQDRLRIAVLVCGARGMAMLRLTQRISPTGRDAPVWLRGHWREKLRHDRRCQVHRLDSPLSSSAAGRHRVTVRARTTGRRWSRSVVEMIDLDAAL